MISDVGCLKLLSCQAWRTQAVEAVITKLILLKRELLPQGSPPASLTRKLQMKWWREVQSNLDFCRFQLKCGHPNTNRKWIEYQQCQAGLQPSIVEESLEEEHRKRRKSTRHACADERNPLLSTSVAVQLMSEGLRIAIALTSTKYCQMMSHNTVNIDEDVMGIKPIPMAHLWVLLATHDRLSYVPGLKPNPWVPASWAHVACMNHAFMTVPEIHMSYGDKVLQGHPIFVTKGTNPSWHGLAPSPSSWQ